MSVLRVLTLFVVPSIYMLVAHSRVRVVDGAPERAEHGPELAEAL